jgi:hypothetical protein
MRLSLVIPVLDSHEAVRRQLLHFERIGLPDDTELILVDDGSDPPIENTSSLDVTILRTNDKRAWTWPLARNAGARVAQGEYLLMYDLDHIVTRELIDFVTETTYPRIQFKREFGILDENGVLTQDRDVLADYGLLPRKSLRVESHHNSFAMKREIFWELGGYVEDRVERSYPQGEDSMFWERWLNYMVRTESPRCADPPTLYVFPTSRWCGDVDYNPHGLFHNLSRKSNRNYWWNQQRRQEQAVG